MLKIITSVVLTLVTIMAVTLYAVTVPAQSQKIEENKTAIEKNTEYIQDVEDFVYTVDGITDGLNTRLETLEDKKNYKHFINITSTTDELWNTSLEITTNSSTLLTPQTLYSHYSNLYTQGLSLGITTIKGMIKDGATYRSIYTLSFDNNKYYFCSLSSGLTIYTISIDYENIIFSNYIIISI